MSRIYLDYAATTPLLPEVRRAMEPWLSSEYGNPSSLHSEGRRAKAAIDEARESLSGALGTLFAEIIFTSSGTEAANLAILGAALANEDAARNRILLGAAEHHCVLHTQPILERLGYRVELIPVDQLAQVRLDVLDLMLGKDVLLVSVMAANNELGTRQPVADMASMAHALGALYHCDAVQTLGELIAPPSSLTNQNGADSRRQGESATPSAGNISTPQPPSSLTNQSEEGGADLCSFSAHKIGGPKGVGALYIRAGTKIRPIAVGGGQEREMRSGTENVAGIVGFGAAVRAGSALAPVDPVARDLFLDHLMEAGFLPTVADRSLTLPGHAHVRLPGVDAETMLIRLDRAGIAASSGAACSSGSLESSHVLRACGYGEKECREGLRFTFGRETGLEEASEAASRVIEAARGIRSMR